VAAEDKTLICGKRIEGGNVGIHLSLSHPPLTGLVCFLSVKMSVWRVFVCVCVVVGTAE